MYFLGGSVQKPPGPVCRSASDQAAPLGLFVLRQHNEGFERSRFANLRGVHVSSAQREALRTPKFKSGTLLEDVKGAWQTLQISLARRLGDDAPARMSLPG
jgi:hypothetical protein